MNQSTQSSSSLPKEPLFSLSFPDGSVFVLPRSWQKVFVDYFGPDPSTYPQVAGHLRFVVSKYIDHQAWPSKFDGIGLEMEAKDLSQYDNPDYCFESWDEWEEMGWAWSEGALSFPPTWAEVAEALLYQWMRSGLMQQALNELAREKGVRPPQVLTPEQFLGLLEQEDAEE